MRVPVGLDEPSSVHRDVLLTLDADSRAGDVAPVLADAVSSPLPRPRLFVGDRALDPADRLLDAGVVAGSVIGVGFETALGRGSAVETEDGLELAIVGGLSAGSATVLLVGPTTIGRSPECDVVLDDREASRLHARLVADASGTMTVEDLDSSNGTTLDGAPVGRATPMAAGQLLGVGGSILVVRPRAAARASLERTGDGRLRYNKPPRTQLRTAQPPIVVPEEPKEPTGSRLPLGTMLAPLVLGPLLVLVTHNPTLMVLVLGAPLMAGANALLDSRSGRRTYRRRLAEYEEARASAGDRITAALHAEEAARRAASPDPATVRAIASGPTGALWERRRDDTDHLELRVGLADQPAALVVSGPVTDAPPLVARMVPVTVGLHGPTVVGVAGPRPEVLALARSLILQTCALQSPVDVSLVVLADERDDGSGGNPRGDWDWVKWLPHTVPAEHEPCQRLVGLNARQRALRLGELEGLIERRRPVIDVGPGDPAARPTTVVVFDHIERLRADEAVAHVLGTGPAAGVVSICIGEDPAGLPAEATVTLAFETDQAGDPVLRVTSPEATLAGVLPEGTSLPHATEVARALAPLFEVAGRRGGKGVLPAPPVDHLGVLAMAPPGPDVVRSRWAGAARGAGAVAPIGLDASGPFEVDLVRDGPHALIAGTTGAGKSELLQTVVASLAATAPPDAVTFLLVDFKGRSAFKDCEQLPHTVGVISNLDGRLVARALDAIQAELRWREARFAEAGAKDFDDYARLGFPHGAVARLVIVVDELKELADAYADAVPRLNQTARLGRGLGVHLLLATQKPASIHGLADLRANTDLRICLRVQDESDSRDLLGVPDAAHISRTTPGRGFARLSDGRVVPFQSGFLGDPLEAEGADDAAVHVRVQAFAGAAVGDLPEAEGRTSPAGEATAAGAAPPSALQALVDAIVAAARAEGVVPPRRPWLPPLPPVISIDDPRLSPPLAVAAFAVGLLDEPNLQLQEPLVLDFDRMAHVLVVGGTRSGRTSTLRTLAGAVAARSSPADVHLYALEFRRRNLEDLERLPHCGGVVGIDDQERLERMLGYLSAEIDRRGNLMGASGSLREQRAQAPAGAELPYVLVLCDNYESFYERFSYEDGGRLVEAFDALLRDGPARGIHLVVTTDNRAAFNRLGAMVDTQLVLRPSDGDGPLSPGAPSAGDVRDLPPGRGLWMAGTPCEAQVALLASNPTGEAQLAALVALAERAAAGSTAVPAERLPTLVRTMPTAITTGEMESRRRYPRPPGAVATFAVGGVEVEPLDVDLRAAGFTFVVAGPRGAGRSTALLSLVSSLAPPGDPAAPRVCVLAPRRSPLRELGRPGEVAVLADAETMTTGLNDFLAASSGPTALVVDDAELLFDNAVSMRLDQLVRAASDDDRIVVVAGTTPDLLRRFSGWSYDARQSRSGLILQPGSPSDGEVLDLRLPRGTVGASSPPGRGILTIRGRWMTAQVALPPQPRTDLESR